MKIHKFAQADKIYFSVICIVYFLYLATFFLFFKKIRDALPPTLIDTSTIVGYSQYNGYSFFLDTIIFVILITTPFMIAYLLKKLKYNK